MAESEVASAESLRQLRFKFVLKSNCSACPRGPRAHDKNLSSENPKSASNGKFQIFMRTTVNLLTTVLLLSWLIE